MLKFVKGDLLSSDTEAIVNTVNTVGIMGKGIALQFKQAYPENYESYRKACDAHLVKLGQMFIFETEQLTNPKYIINFPTKRHWKEKSKIEDIDNGLDDLVENIKRYKISSIAIPPLGCGNGGLSWKLVKKKIESKLQNLSSTKLFVYEPKGAPIFEKMPIRTTMPNMTIGRATLIMLIKQYGIPGYKLTLLEIQKLAYLLQSIGEPLRLNFVKQTYGPYAENLNHVLQRIEGHFVRGYGDRSRTTSIYLMPGASKSAEKFLENQHESLEKLNKVKDFIEGFETPYGMELLTTLHWIANEHAEAKVNLEVAISELQKWSKRKKEKFPPKHIEIAWKRLKRANWIGTSQLS